MTQPASVTLTSIFQTAFTQTKGNFLRFLPILVVALLAVNYVAIEVFGDIDFTSPDALAQFEEKTYLITLISLLVTPVEVGLMLMGVKASRGLAIKATDIFAIFADSAKIVILALILFVIVQIGIMLLILPGLFLLMVTSMAQPLMCDYRLSMVEAVKQSFNACYNNISIVLPFYLTLIILIIASFFTFGIALVFTIPFYLNAKGVLYCHLFDKASKNSDTPTLES